MSESKVPPQTLSPEEAQLLVHAACCVIAADGKIAPQEMDTLLAALDRLGVRHDPHATRTHVVAACKRIYTSGVGSYARNVADKVANASEGARASAIRLITQLQQADGTVRKAELAVAAVFANACGETSSYPVESEGAPIASFPVIENQLAVADTRTGVTPNLIPGLPQLPDVADADISIRKWRWRQANGLITARSGEAVGDGMCLLCGNNDHVRPWKKRVSCAAPWAAPGGALLGLVLTFSPVPSLLLAGIASWVFRRHAWLVFWLCDSCRSRVLWKSAMQWGVSLASIPFLVLGSGFWSVQNPGRFLNLGVGILLFAMLLAALLWRGAETCVGIESKWVTLKVRNPQYIEADHQTLHVLS